jgi:hypothetical protein
VKYGLEEPDQKTLVRSRQRHRTGESPRPAIVPPEPAAEPEDTPRDEPDS